MPLLDRAVGEDLSLRLHLGGDLLAHGAAQQIGGAEGVTGHRLGDLHHLFLVDHDAVGLGQDVVDDRVRRLPLLAVLASAVIRDVGHRAGAIQGDGGDQVLEPVGTHLPQHVAHALAFQLEHPAGVASSAASRTYAGRPAAGRSRSMVMPRPFRKFSARRRMVSVVRPRKSNFTRPACSTCFIEYCVTRKSDFGSRRAGPVPPAGGRR